MSQPVVMVDVDDVNDETVVSELEEAVKVPQVAVMELHETWSLFYDAPSKSKQAVWGESMRRVMEIGYVEEFWSLFNNLVPPSRLPNGAYYNLFRQGIKPEWEDPKNEEGGKWVLSLPRSSNKIDEMWLYSAMAVIGENFGEWNDEICGVVVNIRQHKDRLSLWTKTADNESACMKIGKQWKTHLNLSDTFRLTYQAHKESMKNKSGFRSGALYEC